MKWTSPLQEDLLTFIDVRTLKVKHEEQFKYEVCMALCVCAVMAFVVGLYGVLVVVVGE